MTKKEQGFNIAPFFSWLRIDTWSYEAKYFDIIFKKMCR